VIRVKKVKRVTRDKREILVTKVKKVKLARKVIPVIKVKKGRRVLLEIRATKVRKVKKVLNGLPILVHRLYLELKVTSTSTPITATFTNTKAVLG
jgi:hypothetical protein